MACQGVPGEEVENHA